MSDPVISHILHAKVERVSYARGAEVHLTVGVHHDRRLTLAMTSELAAQLAPAIAQAARSKHTGRPLRKNQGEARLPILKPAGGVL